MVSWPKQLSSALGNLAGIGLRWWQARHLKWLFSQLVSNCAFFISRVAALRFLGLSTTICSGSKWKIVFEQREERMWLNPQQIKSHPSMDPFYLNIHMFKFPICKTGLMTSSSSPRGGVEIDPWRRVKYSKLQWRMPWKGPWGNESLCLQSRPDWCAVNKV